MKTRSIVQKLTPYVPGVRKEGALKLSSNENPLGMSGLSKQAIQNEIEFGHIYPDGGCTKLRHSLAHLNNIHHDQLIIGNGSDEIFTFAACTFVNPGENTISAKETFSMYKYATTLYDGEYKTIPLNNGIFDLPAILAAINEKTRIVFLCNPNNPTGTYFSHKDLVDFLDKAPKDCLVIVDEAYYEYADTSDYPNSVSLLPKYKNLLITRTFSKIYGLASLRIGYGIGNSELIQQLQSVRGPFNVNGLAQSAAVAALESSEFTKQSLELNKIGKEYLYTELKKRGLSFYETQSNFICVNLPKNAKEVFTSMMNNDVTIRPLTSFSLPNSIRITISSKEENDKMLEALDKSLS